MSGQDQPQLELKNLSRIYRTRGSLFGGGDKEVVALNNLSFSIGQGEIFGLVGESGSGKTTCGRLVVGLEQPDHGSITFEGAVVSGLSASQFKPFRRRIQMVFQDPYQSLNPQLTILDSVAEPLITNRVGAPAEHLGMVLDSLESAGLNPAQDFIYRFPHQLSGGQRQRVAIARAMVLKPTILVADEPTSMLDASYSAQIFEILLEVRQKLSTTILFITHSLAAARYLCDRVAVIYRGNLMEMGPAGEVIRRPRHPYTQALLDATPKFGRCDHIRRFDTLLARPRQDDIGPGCPFYHRCALGQKRPCREEFPSWDRLADSHFAACHLLGHTGSGPAVGDVCAVQGP